MNPVRPTFEWQLRTRSLLLGPRTLIMGIVNVTPDSFSDGGKYLTAGAATGHALRLLEEGADILDLGGESTRPGATPITAEEEQGRLLPVVRSILIARPEAILSIDTYHHETAKAALDEGAEIINDVSGLMWDDKMAGTLAQARPGTVLMHTRGRPPDWASLPPLEARKVLPLVIGGLRETLAKAAAAGMQRETILLDPGFGFGKRGEENVVLLSRFRELNSLGLPLLAGISRKRFLTSSLGDAIPAQREAATIAATTAANSAALDQGAHILRVHDVAAARAAAAVWDAISAASRL